MKIRGFRIELGEIESLLDKQPAVARAVVTVHDDATGPRLAAYIVPAAGSAIPEAQLVPQLRESLLDKLPHYMVPTSFTVLEELPLTPNGKIDRRSLPAPASSRHHQNVDYAPPTTEMEKLVARVWQRALSIDRVGVHDRFLDIGGHSLLMMQVATVLKAETGVRIDLRSFFLETLGQLAEHLESSAAPAPAEQRGVRSILRRLVPGRRQPGGAS